MMTKGNDFMRTTRIRDAVAVLLIGLVFHAWGCRTNAVRTDGALELSGTWRFAIDPNDEGMEGRWFETALADQVTLPGSMATNGKGFEVDINTPWTGSIMDSTWFTADEYEPYRQPGNIKVPYWLQPDTYYKGAAWYQREITIPDTGFEEGAELFIERAHWETRVWIDGNEIGMQNSL